MSDSEELAREAEAARARLSDTAERIRDRMSPGQMMDEVLNQFRSGDGGRMLSNMQHQVRDNPMALALVGTGLAWLMMGSGRQAPAPRATPYYPDYPSAGSEPVDTWREDVSRSSTWQEDSLRGDVWHEDTARSSEARSLTGSSGTGARPASSMTGSSGMGSSGMGSSAAGSSGTGSSGTGFASSSRPDSSSSGSMTETVKDSVTDMAHGASEALSSARSAVGEGLHEASDRAQRLAHDVRSAGSHAFRDVRHSAADMGHQARGTFLDVLEREPLVIGALGVAVGAALGAFLPATDVERRHLGPTGEALKEKATELVDRGVAKAKDAAAEVYETARDEADRQGLLPGDKPVADKIGAVVRAAGQAAGQAAGEVAGEVADRNAPDASSSGKAGTGTTGAGTTGTGTGAGAGSGTSSNPSSSTTSGTTSGTGTGQSGHSDKGAPSGQSRDRT